MAATATVAQVTSVRKSPINKSGVLTLSGFGVRVGCKAGISKLKMARTNNAESSTTTCGPQLKRLVIIGDDGFVSLSALRWIADVDAPLVMLDRTGRILFVTGPTASSDARLRRAQALALSNGADLKYLAS